MSRPKNKEEAKTIDANKKQAELYARMAESQGGKYAETRAKNQEEQEK